MQDIGSVSKQESGKEDALAMNNPGSSVFPGDKNKKNYDIFDLLKFIFSIFIVAIHTSLYPNILYPWLRIAVPMFFIISSYLFFSKTKKLNAKEQNKALWKFVKRNLILYAVWFIIQLHITYKVRKAWFSYGTLHAIKMLLKNLFFDGTFLASWFLMANVIAVIIVFFASKKVNIYVTLIASALINCLCCLLSGYKETLGFVGAINDFLSPIIGDMCFNFFVALFWIALGKAFVEKKIEIKCWIAIVGLVVCAILLYLEWKLTSIYLNLVITRDCFFLLMPTCLFLFALVLKLDKITFKCNKFFRASSTLIYCLHYPIFFDLYTVFSEKCNYIPSIMMFSTTLTLALAVSILIINLSRIKFLRWLKFLY